MTDKEALKLERDAHITTAQKLTEALAEVERLKRLCRTHGLLV